MYKISILAISLHRDEKRDFSEHTLTYRFQFSTHTHTDAHFYYASLLCSSVMLLMHLSLL